MTKVITFHTHKGGCGKSTSSLNTAAILTEKGYKVLLIDCDAQCDSTSMFGAQTADDGELNITDVVYNISHRRKGFDVHDAIQHVTFGGDDQ